MMEAMEFITDGSPELEPVEPEESPGVFQTVRVETETLPPLVELGRKLLVKAQDGDAEGVKDLMQQGAPFTTDWLGTSAIHWACQLNHFEVADVLLKAGISRDARNKVDRTPLHVTAQEGHVQILKLLLNHGVDVDAVDMLRMTPLHWAAEYGHEECVRLLLEHGADPVAVNKFDKTPDQIAFDNNRLDITHIIQEYAENPLRHVRRKEAKEKQKMAAAAHKAVLELERVNKLMVAKQAAIAEKGKLEPPKGGIKESIQLVNGAQVRVVKIPKRKGRMVFESTLKPTGSLVLSPTQPLTVVDDNQPPESPVPPVPAALPLPMQQPPITVVSNDTANTEKTLALLQAHGITMLPNDDSTIVASAVQSGQKIVLTEAGKMALNLTEKPALKPVQVPVQLPMGVSPIKGLIKLPPELLRGKKLIKIRADQLINMKNEKRVIIQTDKRFQPANVLNKPRLEIPVSQTHPVEVVVTKTTVNNKTQLTSSFVQRERGPIVNGLLPNELEASDSEAMKSEQQLELERIRRELEERTNEVRMLREKLDQKEQEVEEYKRLLDLVRVDDLP